MPITLMFFMVIGMVTVVSLSLSQTTDSMVYRGTLKVQADELAESGIQVMYDQICRRMRNGSALNQTLTGYTLNSTLDGASKNLGSYEAEVVDVTHKDTVDPAGQPSGTILREYEFHLKGTGTAPNGTYSVKYATFKADIVTLADAFNDPVREWTMYPAAIQSNSNVFIKADANIRTLDVSTVDKEAHIIANRGIVWMPASTIHKGAITAPDVITVEGHIMVPDQPSNAYYNSTRSAMGIGNYENRKNFQSAGPWVNKTSQYPVVANEVTPMGLGIPFPTQAQLNAWTTNWYNTASGHQSSVSVIARTSTSIATNGLGVKAINAPAFVESDFTVDEGDTIHLVPHSDDPAENIIYIRGNLTNRGTIINDGVTLVIQDVYSDTEEATYRLDTQFTKYNNLSEVYQKAGLISLHDPDRSARSDDEGSINITSDIDNQYGLVYAINGYIKVTGNLEFNGILMSGCSSIPSSISSPRVKGGIHIEPDGGQDFTINYVREAKGFSLPGQLVDATKIVSPFRAAALGNWMKKR